MSARIRMGPEYGRILPRVASYSPYAAAETCGCICLSGSKIAQRLGRRRGCSIGQSSADVGSDRNSAACGMAEALDLVCSGSLVLVSRRPPPEPAGADKASVLIIRHIGTHGGLRRVDRVDKR